MQPSQPQQPQNPNPGQPKIIKRYSNRKLYDTERSCYVTLEEIAQMVKDGVEVRIIDNKSKEDLTSVTLTQIIFAEEKKQKSILPLSTLRDIIRSGGESLSEFFTKTLAEPISQFKEGPAKRVETFFRRGESENGASAAVSPPPYPSTPTAPPEPEHKDRGSLREWFDAQRASIEDWQHRIDDNMKESFGSLAVLPKIHLELERLSGRIDELEDRIARLEGDDESEPV